MRKVFLLAFALFAWNILANAQESDERYIEVTGSSEIEVVPDEIHFLIQIKEYWEEEYTGKSKKEEDFRTKVPLTVIEKDLRKSLRKIGISDEAIRTQEVGDYWRQREGIPDWQTTGYSSYGFRANQFHNPVCQYMGN